MTNETKIGIPFRRQIPREWTVKIFDEIADIDGHNLSNNTPSNYQFNYISLSDIDVKKGTFSTSKMLFSSAPSRARRIVKENDILVSTVRPNLKGFCLIKNKGTDIIASTGFSIVSVTGCNTEFLFQYLFSSAIERQFHKLIVGSNYPAINSSDIRKLKIVLPPLPEQEAIAKILQSVDHTTHTIQNLILQKEKQKKWLMNNLLTGKKKLNGYSSRWKKRRITELFKPKRRYINWDENELYSLISIKRRNGGIFYRPSLHGRDIGVKKLKEVRTSDFLISKRQASHGAWAVVDNRFDKAAVSDEYICLNIITQFLQPRFWKYYSQIPLLTHYANVDSNGVHIEKSIFDFTIFKKRGILIPTSLEEQNAIAQILETADKMIALLQAKKELLVDKKKGLMQQLLTGKKRVKI